MATLHTKRYAKVTIFGLGASLFMLSLAPVSASSANISRSYQSSQTVLAGSLVSLDASKSDYVQAANTNNAARIFGIAVISNDSLLAVDAKKGSVQVATSGTAPALVSDLNGAINVGDQIAVSPFDGIGMKAPSGSRIIGLAQTAFNNGLPGIQRRTVKDNSGVSKQIAVGTIKVNIAPGSSTGSSTEKINGVQKLAKSITGRLIPTGRIVVALIIVGVTLIALITLIYGSVYSTIISVGRNPLAKYAIYRSMASVLLLAFITAAVAMGMAVLLLR